MDALHAGSLPRLFTMRILCIRIAFGFYYFLFCESQVKILKQFSCHLIYYHMAIKLPVWPLLANLIKWKWSICECISYTVQNVPKLCGECLIYRLHAKVCPFVSGWFFFLLNFSFTIILLDFIVLVISSFF